MILLDDPNIMEHGYVFFSLLFLVLSHEITMAGAQSGSPISGPENNNGYNYAKFTPSMAIIIVVLIASFFFIGFFSIYIRHCSNGSGGLGSVRQALSMRRRGVGQVGLDPLIIETFPTFSYSEVKDHKIGKGSLECAVCLNEFEDNETLRLIPKCDHVFHPECIDAWLVSHVTCPVCRADLVPKDGDEPVDLPELTNSNGETDENMETSQRTNSLRNEEIVIQVADSSENQPQRDDVNRNSNFEYLNRPLRSLSIKRLRTFNFGRFRSHSTGHSLVQPEENRDRFTLRLPEEVRKEVLDRAMLKRTKSLAIRLSGEGSSRRGFRTGAGEGSRKAGRWFERSNRWSFNMARPVFSRGPLMTSPRVVAQNGEGSSKGGRTPVKMPSFKCLEPKTGDESRHKVSNDSVHSPV